MAEVTINEAILSNIGDAIRNKLSVETTYKPSQMASAISGIEVPRLEQRTFSSNGEYLPNYGKNGMSKVIVNVVPSYSAADEGKVVSSGALVPQSIISISQNGSYDTTLNDQVIVDVVPSLESISISQNGIFTPSVDGFSEVVVDVQPSLGSISISENGTYIPSDVDGFNEVIVNVAGGGGAGSEPALIERNYSELSNAVASAVGSWLCMSMGNLRGVSLPNVSRIEGSAFYSCSNLSEVYFPRCEYIKGGAFSNCVKLVEAIFQSCTSIGMYAFAYCSKLTTASFPLCEMVSDSAFYSCSSLMSAYFPECKTVGANAFGSCMNLASVNIENCEVIKSSAFQYGFSLPQIRLLKCSVIYGRAFYGCSRLESVYLLNSSVVELKTYNAFANTPLNSSTFLGYFGSIYVPSSLYNDYIASASWASYADRITSYVEG